MRRTSAGHRVFAIGAVTKGPESFASSTPLPDQFANHCTFVGSRVTAAVI